MQNEHILYCICTQRHILVDVSHEKTLPGFKKSKNRMEIGYLFFNWFTVKQIEIHTQLCFYLELQDKNENGSSKMHDWNILGNITS